MEVSATNMHVHKQPLTSGKYLYTSGELEVQWDPKREQMVIATSALEIQSLFLLPEEVEALKQILADL